MAAPRNMLNQAKMKHIPPIWARVSLEVLVSETIWWHFDFSSWFGPSVPLDLLTIKSLLRGCILQTWRGVRWPNTPSDGISNVWRRQAKGEHFGLPPYHFCTLPGTYYLWIRTNDFFNAASPAPWDLLGANKALAVEQEHCSGVYYCLILTVVRDCNAVNLWVSWILICLPGEELLLSLKNFHSLSTTRGPENSNLAIVWRQPSINKQMRLCHLSCWLLWQLPAKEELHLTLADTHLEALQGLSIHAYKSERNKKHLKQTVIKQKMHIKMLWDATSWSYLNFSNIPVHI